MQILILKKSNDGIRDPNVLNYPPCSAILTDLSNAVRDDDMDISVGRKGNLVKYRIGTLQVGILGCHFLLPLCEQGESNALGDRPEGIDGADYVTTRTRS
jgi:hypothetical protein